MRRSASAAASEAGGRTGEDVGGATARAGDAGGVACSREVESWRPSSRPTYAAIASILRSTAAMRRSASAAASEASGRTGEDASGATGEDVGGALARGGAAGGVACSGEVESR